jgi:hypothetical protein
MCRTRPSAIRVLVERSLVFPAATAFPALPCPVLTQACLKASTDEKIKRKGRIAAPMYETNALH